MGFKAYFVRVPNILVHFDASQTLFETLVVHIGSCVEGRVDGVFVAKLLGTGALLREK